MGRISQRRATAAAVAQGAQRYRSNREFANIIWYGYIMKCFNAAIISCALVFPLCGYAKDAPLRLAIAGLAHGHVSGFLNAAAKRQDARVVAIYDPEAALVASYAKRYNIPP